MADQSHCSKAEAARELSVSAGVHVGFWWSLAEGYCSPTATGSMPWHLCIDRAVGWKSK
jgi:hypothetical protein